MVKRTRSRSRARRGGQDEPSVPVAESTEGSSEALAPVSEPEVPPAAPTGQGRRRSRRGTRKSRKSRKVSRRR
jgi:hypothetical protein